MSMGSNPGARGSYEPAIEIYTPAYLYDANDQLITTNRPSITGMSATGVDRLQRAFLRELHEQLADRLRRAGASRLLHPCFRHGSAADRPLRRLAAAARATLRAGAARSASRARPTGTSPRPATTCCSCSTAPECRRRRSSSSSRSTRGQPPSGAITSPASDITIPDRRHRSTSARQSTAPPSTPGSSPGDRPRPRSRRARERHLQHAGDLRRLADRDRRQRQFGSQPTDPDDHRLAGDRGLPIAVSPSAQEVNPGRVDDLHRDGLPPQRVRRTR